MLFTAPYKVSRSLITRYLEFKNYKIIRGGQDYNDSVVPSSPSKKQPLSSDWKNLLCWEEEILNQKPCREALASIIFHSLRNVTRRQEKCNVSLRIWTDWIEELGLKLR
jgi:hypothetical protein